MLAAGVAVSDSFWTLELEDDWEQFPFGLTDGGSCCNAKLETIESKSATIFPLISAEPGIETVRDSQIEADSGACPSVRQGLQTSGHQREESDLGSIIQNRGAAPAFDESPAQRSRRVWYTAGSASRLGADAEQALLGWYSRLLATEWLASDPIMSAAAGVQGIPEHLGAAEIEMLIAPAFDNGLRSPRSREISSKMVPLHLERALGTAVCKWLRRVSHAEVSTFEGLCAAALLRGTEDIIPQEGLQNKELGQKADHDAELWSVHPDNTTETERHASNIAASASAASVSLSDPHSTGVGFGLLALEALVRAGTEGQLVGASHAVGDALAMCILKFARDGGLGDASILRGICRRIAATGAGTLPRCTALLRVPWTVNMAAVEAAAGELAQLRPSARLSPLARALWHLSDCCDRGLGDGLCAEMEEVDEEEGISFTEAGGNAQVSIHVVTPSTTIRWCIGARFRCCSCAERDSIRDWFQHNVAMFMMLHVGCGLQFSRGLRCFMQAARAVTFPSRNQVGAFKMPDCRVLPNTFWDRAESPATFLRKDGRFGGGCSAARSRRPLRTERRSARSIRGSQSLHWSLRDCHTV